MTWYAWVVIAVLVLNTIACVLLVGRERKPLTPVDIVLIGATNAAIIWAIVALATQ